MVSDASRGAIERVSPRTDGGGSRTGLRVVLEGGIVQIDDLALRRHAGEGGQGKQGEREGVARARHRDFKLPVA